MGNQRPTRRLSREQKLFLVEVGEAGLCFGDFFLILAIGSGEAAGDNQSGKDLDLVLIIVKIAGWPLRTVLARTASDPGTGSGQSAKQRDSEAFQPLLPLGSKVNPPQ